MRTFTLRSSLLVICLFATQPNPSVAAPPSLLRIFGKAPAAISTDGGKQLSEVDGPWMILAASFAGEPGKQQAQSLADELSRDYGMPSFVHEEKFDFGGKIDRPNTDGRVLRYANQSKYQAYAVLVGEYDSVDHPQLIRDLKRIKESQPKSMNGDGIADAKEDTPLAAVQRLQKSLLKKTGKTESGPLANAFATTNPMLPEEFFSAPEIDSFVMELNDQVEHSLLENEGKYTVVVCTFAGLGTIVGGKQEKAFQPSSERMDGYAASANKMVLELRKIGVEAYQFHDRNRSLVTIGSFTDLGRQMPDGGFEYDPAIRKVMETYCAGNQSQPTKFGPGIAANHIANIPYDIQPLPIAVPKKSKRSLFIGKLGMR